MPRRGSTWRPRRRLVRNVTKLPPSLLISAYLQGVFPMGVDGELHWFSPDPRAIVPLDAFHVSKTLAQTIRRQPFEIRIDGAFRDVVLACADRPEGTWITGEIVKAYTELNRLGFAHSVEAWHRDSLVGGLYGVSIGGAFFGESMFHRLRDASKVALSHLVECLRSRGFMLLDIQFMTAHLKRFGAVEIPRDDYLMLLRKAVAVPITFV
ncbi:MAG: leucyl/phenylalanyl-tRNA--protein transferase [Planctomycetes bacterium UTPLA1]|nr:MAG: leucyl/phenylalanyl-tRNA--protein transferase [Planctomycetes bacterium UTPLA1]